VTFDYDNANRRTSLTLPNGIVMTYGYDDASQLTGITYKSGTTTLGDLTYGYDLAGRRTSMGGSYARTTLPTALGSAVYNAANQLTNWDTVLLTYDNNGNMTSDGTNSYVWNSRNTLDSMNAPTNTFQYDAFSRRVSKTIGTTTTKYLYDGATMVQELDGSPTPAPTANLLTGGIDEVFTRTTAAPDPEGTRNFLTNGLRSTIALTDSTQAFQTTYIYEPFGNTGAFGSATSNSYQYTGRENDGTGLHYYRARYYSPTLQRFISEDPIGFLGGVNLYRFVKNDAINKIDPLGLWTLQLGISVSGSRFRCHPVLGARLVERTEPVHDMLLGSVSQ
jgi:RHS repeat-associated protein